jgi:exodeoxyribonuclease VII small subunit
VVLGADYNRRFKFHMAKTSTSTPVAADPAAHVTYEEALGELERLVAAMEGGQLPLDRLLESYKRGADLLSFCRSRLEAVEEQVKVLEDGQLKPWSAA